MINKKLFLSGIAAGAFYICIAFLPAYAKDNPGLGQSKANEKPDKTNKIQAVIGSLENIKGNSLTVKEKKNQQQTSFEVDTQVKITGKDKQLVKLGALKLKDMIALIGSGSADATGSGKYKVNKIFVKEASQSAQMKRRAVMGVITQINGNLLTLAHQVQSDRTYQVQVTDLTIIRVKSETDTDASASASASALAVGQRITAVGDLGPSGLIIAKQIHIIPGKATGVFKKMLTATPSASLVATPSAQALASATVSASIKPSLVPSSLPSPTTSL